MKEVFPNYYSKFRCIADKCKHSCCIGWEIDIDEETMSLYSSLEGELGERIRENIEGEPWHFVLKEDERCPFLNKNGLCDIITELGEGAICDICYLHPRFSNTYDHFIETGLGLCCEEAVRIILTEEEKFSLPLPDSVKDCEFFIKRGEVFDILQNRDINMLERLKRLAKAYFLEFKLSNEELYDLFTSLEMLDGDLWKKKLERLKKAKSTDIFEREDMQIFFEQLACYFVFRHFDKGIEFPLISTFVIGAIISECEKEEAFDIVRMYSSEIEYSEENTEKVIRYGKTD